MSIPRDHHFVPVCYLQHWRSWRDGKVYEYAIKHSGKFVSKRVGPRGTGFQRDLYSFPELPADAAQYLESNFLSLVDSDAANALKRHLAMARELTPRLRNGWSRFLLSLMMRHPDTMSEFRDAAKSLWAKGKDEAQRNYEKIRKPEDPETFEEYAATVDPQIEVKMRLYSILMVFNSERIGNHLNKMKWAVADVTPSPQRLVTSDRPLVYSNLGGPDGFLFLPISPIKLFVAANTDKTLSEFSKGKSSEVVSKANALVVARARRYVYARDNWQRDFIKRTMSTKMEPSPIFKDLDRYESESTTPSA